MCQGEIMAHGMASLFMFLIFFGPTRLKYFSSYYATNAHADRGSLRSEPPSKVRYSDYG